VQSLSRVGFDDRNRDAESGKWNAEFCGARMKKSKSLVSALALVALLDAPLLLGGQAACAGQPATTLISAPNVAPSAAWSYYGGSTTHTNGVAAWASGSVFAQGEGNTLPALPPEMMALGKALGANGSGGLKAGITAQTYAQNIRDYIRNNIDVEYRFGLGKGGRGALIDQSGTPFDQAELMVKLLRYGGITSSYQVGTITLNAQQFGLWTGLVTNLNQSAQTFTVNAQAACQFLADGGIPANVNGGGACSSLSGNLTTVTLGHIWVSANGLVYDPGYKQYHLVASQNLPAAMGCGTAGASTCGSAVLGAAMQSATTGQAYGANYVQNVNVSAATTTQTQQAIALQKNIQSVDPSQRVIDVVGGQIIAPYSDTPAASLPYSSAVQYSWGGDIPDVFRTTLNVTAANGSVLFYADEIAGHHIVLLGSKSGSPQSYYIDFSAGQFPSCASNCWRTDTSPNSLNLDVTHPYAANNGTYGSEHVLLQMVDPPLFASPYFRANPPVTVTPGVYPYTIENSWSGSYPVTLIHNFGSASASTQQFYGNKGLPNITDQGMGATPSPHPSTDGPAQLICAPATTTFVYAAGCEDDAQPLMAQTIPLYRNLIDKIVTGVTNTKAIHHHDVGLVFASRATGQDHSTMSEMVSVDSPTASTSDQARAFEIESLLLPEAEAAAMVGGGVVSGNLRSPAQIMTTALAMPSSRTFDFNPSSLTTYVNSSPNSATYPGGGGGPIDQQRLGRLNSAGVNGNSVIFNDGGWSELFYQPNQRSYMLFEGLKGATTASDPIADAIKTTDVADLSATRKKSLSISDATGTLGLTAPPDIMSGAGSFPLSLPLVRTYAPTTSSATTNSSDTVGHIVVTNSGTQYVYDYHSSSSSSYSGPDSEVGGRIGGGWTHNYNVTASWTSNAAKALGEDTALDASRTIAAVTDLNDLLQPGLAQGNLSSFETRLASMIVGGNMGFGLYNSAVIIKKGAEAEAFLQLPDGTFNAPVGSNAKVTMTYLGPVEACGGGSTSSGPFTFTGPGLTGDMERISYTGRAGDVINFSVDGFTTSGLYNGTYYYCNAMLSYKADNWTFPNGVQLTFNYQLTLMNGTTSASLAHVPSGGIPVQMITGPVQYLLKSVQNNLGRQLNFSYGPVVFTGHTENTSSQFGFYPLQKVTDENGRQATYSLTCPGSGSLCLTVTDANGLSTVYDYSLSNPNATLTSSGLTYPAYLIPHLPSSPLRRIFSPVQTAAIIQNASTQLTPFSTLYYDDLNHVTSVVDGNGHTTNYAAGGVMGTELWKPSWVTSPMNETTSKVYDLHNQPLSIVDPLGNLTTATYDNAGRLLTQTLPEGNYDVHTYDMRSNPLTVTKYPKPGSSLPPIKTSTQYMEASNVISCANAVTCNDASSMTDANNNTTNYQWDASSGNLTQILKPAVLSAADNSNIRPQIDLGYSTLNGISFLSSKTEKIDGSHSTTTTYGYNANNHYVLQTVIQDSGGLKLQTCLKFDNVGNLIGKTDPNAALTTCP